jgi:hypothetical protein
VNNSIRNRETAIPTAASPCPANGNHVQVANLEGDQVSNLGNSGRVRRETLTGNGEEVAA